MIDMRCYPLFLRKIIKLKWFFFNAIYNSLIILWYKAILIGETLKKKIKNLFSKILDNTGIKIKDNDHDYTYEFLDFVNKYSEYTKISKEQLFLNKNNELDELKKIMSYSIPNVKDALEETNKDYYSFIEVINLARLFLKQNNKELWKTKKRLKK